jgi:integrase
VAVAEPEPDRGGQAFAAGAFEAVAALAAGSGPVDQRGLEGRGLGRLRLDRDDDWHGELCAVQRNEVDLNTAVMVVRTGLKRIDGEWVRCDTKTHQQRRIALDQETVAVLPELIARQDARAAQP